MPSTTYPTATIEQATVKAFAALTPLLISNDVEIQDCVQSSPPKSRLALDSEEEICFFHGSAEGNFNLLILFLSRDSQQQWQATKAFHIYVNAQTRRFDFCACMEEEWKIRYNMDTSWLGLESFNLFSIRPEVFQDHYR